MKIKWIKAKKKLPPNSIKYRCYIKFVDDGHISLSDGFTVNENHKLGVNGKIKWLSLTDAGTLIEKLEENIK